MPVLKLLPAYKDYIWGGSKLKTDFNKAYDGEVLAETWELSCHKDGESTISNGTYSGKNLSQYITDSKSGVLGSNSGRFSSFPVLVKLIDAKQDLSVQVHPSDEYALSREGQYGKTEMWYVMDCEEDAVLYYGLSRKMNRKELKECILENCLIEVLNKIKVSRGDVFFLPAGTLHAIGAGITVAEVQQNSNLTYRVYDYGRVGPDGSPRELHIEKALDVITLEPALPPARFGKHLGFCEYFAVDELEVQGKYFGTASGDTFHHLLIVDGEGKIYTSEDSCSFVKGDSLFIPAGTWDYNISGHCTALLTTIPPAETAGM